MTTKNSWTLRGAAIVGALALSITTVTTAMPAAAVETALPIAKIQGVGSATPYAGKKVTTTPSVVTAVYPSGSGEFAGFVIQTPGTGGNRTRSASDAIFVYAGSTDYASLKIGDAVQVSGTAGEYKGLTQLTSPTITKVTTKLPAVQPVTRSWASTASAREAFESMLYFSTETFQVSDTYPLLPYGELGLAAGSTLPFQPTQVARPGTPAAAIVEARNEVNTVNLDDGSNKGYTVTDKLPARTLPYLTRGKGVTIGDSAKLTEPVVIDFRNDTWKFNPTRAITPKDPVATIEHRATPKAPKAGGDVSVASFNVLNYFTTLGKETVGCKGRVLSTDGSFNQVDGCDVRGAWDAADLYRQQSKIVTAINSLDASVVGLMEIENSIKLGEARDEALASLVKALNAKAGRDKWDYVRSSDELQPVADQDVITSALIYQKNKVELRGKARALGSAAGADGAFANARTPIAQAFQPKGSGKTFLVVVNHFKSKGSAPSSGPDADQGDGQGAWNAARVAQADALADWLPSLTKEAGTTDVALIGDFNSYAQEDPIKALNAAGYTDAAPKGSWTYSFGGRVGSLDHVLISSSLRQRLQDSAVWNINAGESPALEYSQYRTTTADLNTAKANRSSDHDPVVIGFAKGKADPRLTILNFNDFHGRIAASSPDTVQFFGTVEEQRARAGEKNSLVLSAGDSIGGSLFTSFIQDDNPTLDVLNAAGLDASAVGNHEFDRGYDDLVGRVDEKATFPYLGANVYRKGTTTPALKEYATFKRSGLTVAVVGAVTQETSALVSPDGISTIEFGDPVAAVNRVTAKLTDGNPANGEADVVLAEYHDGATTGDPDSTLDEQVAAGGSFADIVQKTSPKVAAIFTAHTHQSYTWDAKVPGSDRTRPVIQSGSYASYLGKVVLDFDSRGRVKSYTRENLPASTTPVAELKAQYPRVAAVADVVTSAIAKADEIGKQKVGTTTAPITRALADGKEDRASESTLSNLVADMFYDTTATSDADATSVIGVQNPGGTRADLDAGDVTYAEAAAVLPFANSLNTTTLTGAQVKTLLEQQWQVDANGAPIPSGRPYLQLGLSDNVSYTYDSSRPLGDRITSVTVGGQRLDTAKQYRITSGSFLIAGGDNFHVLKQGTNTVDTGRVDLEAWVDFVKSNSPLEPDFGKRAVEVSPTPATVKVGQTVSFSVKKLDLTSTGAPKNGALTVSLGDTQIGTATATGGAAEISVTIPAGTATGASELTVASADTGTTVRIPVTVE